VSNNEKERIATIATNGKSVESGGQGDQAVGSLLEGLYYEMVLAPFYQDFMKSLDEHINELVEVKCSRMMKTLQYQINDLRRENQRLHNDLKSKRTPNGIATTPQQQPAPQLEKLDKLDEDDDMSDSMHVEPIEAPSSNGMNGHGLNGMASLLETGLKREMSPSLTNGSTGNGIDEDDDVIHFTNLHTDDCPPDLEEIGRDDDDADYRFPSGATSGLPTLNDTYGEKTIDEDDMEAYFNDENFLCRLCNRQLCSRHSLMRHVKTVHTAVRRYKCDFCDSSFKSADVKKVHVKNVHANEKALAELTGALTSNGSVDGGSSPQSPKKTKIEPKVNGMSPKGDSISALVEVSSNTSTEKPKIFSCSICKERFSSRGEISGHSRRVHGNAKPFKCPYCDAGFTRIGTLNMHLKKHTL